MDNTGRDDDAASSTAAATTPSVGTPQLDNSQSRVASGASALTTNTTAVTPLGPEDGGAVASSRHLLDDPKLSEILLSDVGTEQLLARLKQSVVSAREFSTFVKKLASQESEHQQSVKKLARNTRDAVKRPDARQGTFARQFDEMVAMSERGADASNSYIAALHIMHDELAELAKTIDRTRKSVKESALRQEKLVVEAEQAAEKAKSKYDQAAEDLEKMRTGDPTKNKFGFKQSRTPQHEDELQRKVTTAESEFQQRVAQAEQARRELLAKHRPAAVKQLKDLILECDAGMSLQLQKYANLSETLALNRGFIIAPLKPRGSTGGAPTIKELAAQVDNELDFYNFVLGIPRAKKLNRKVPTFQKHPTLASAYGSSAPSSSAGGAGTGTGAGAGVGAGVGAAVGAGTAAAFASRQEPASSSSQYNYSSGSTAGSTAPSSGNAGAASSPTTTRVVGSGSALTGPVLAKVPTSSSMGQPAGPRDAPDTTTFNGGGDSYGDSYASPKLPYPSTGDSVAGAGAAAAAAGAGAGAAAGAASPSAFPPGTSAGHMVVYGTPLEELLDFEEGTVPRIVYQCVQAIDSFGLEVEHIYRVNGNSEQIAEIKRLFDLDSTAVDLLHPSETLNDIHSVASALKLYFRELPDPLLTEAFHREFINAAKLDDDVQRRDAIHATINKLPDPNYTTLRYLVFHLYRVQEREAVNRMSIRNLAIVWGHILLVTDPSNVADMALQTRIVETIIFNAYVIFDAE